MLTAPVIDRAELLKNPLLDFREVSELLSTPVATLRGWRRRGLISTIKLGGKRFTTLAEVQRLREEGTKS
ncbi:MAG: helix-turn-helix domain-containing protein [Terriglobales bacterium]